MLNSVLAVHNGDNGIHRRHSLYVLIEGERDSYRSRVGKTRRLDNDVVEVLPSRK